MVLCAARSHQQQQQQKGVFSADEVKAALQTAAGQIQHLLPASGQLPATNVRPTVGYPRYPCCTTCPTNCSITPPGQHPQYRHGTYVIRSTANRSTLNSEPTDRPTDRARLRRNPPPRVRTDFRPENFSSLTIFSVKFRFFNQ